MNLSHYLHSLSQKRRLRKTDRLIRGILAPYALRIAYHRIAQENGYVNAGAFATAVSIARIPVTPLPSGETEAGYADTARKQTRNEIQGQSAFVNPRELAPLLAKYESQKKDARIKLDDVMESIRIRESLLPSMLREYHGSLEAFLLCSLAASTVRQLLRHSILADPNGAHAIA